MYLLLNYGWNSTSQNDADYMKNVTISKYRRVFILRCLNVLPSASSSKRYIKQPYSKRLCSGEIQTIEHILHDYCIHSEHRNELIITSEGFFSVFPSRVTWLLREKHTPKVPLAVAKIFSIAVVHHTSVQN